MSPTSGAQTDAANVAADARDDVTWPPDLSSELLRPDTVVGNYRLVEQIGAGGMGVVYRAEQLRPVKRTVALKLIKLGMDTRDVVARFETERQALAILEHPGVARVYDAGATPTGRPYFVMEYVPGVPITEYCDAHQLTTAQRLELFEQVCHAVQHAHYKGVLHRDLKPSNILVTEIQGRPQPKVIDFGVAKAVGEHAANDPLATRAGQLVGTPAYMSPEQAAGAPVDTRADVYSLGLVLYELLAGALPFARVEQAHQSDVEPPRPSARLSTLAVADVTTIAARRATDSTRLLRLVRGDLDVIVMKAIDRDPARRYGTAEALAEDARRHRMHEPIAARPPTLAYQARKFARRNRLLVAASIMVIAAVLGGALVATVGLVRARQALAREALARQAEADQRRRAQNAAAVSARVNKLLGDMLAAPNPNRALGKPVLVRDIMDQAARELDGGALRDQPLVEASLRYTVGSTYHGLGEYQAAHEQLARALGLRRSELGPGDPATLESMTMDVSALDHLGRTREAAQLAREALDAARAAAPAGTDPADSPTALMAAHALAGTLHKLGRYDETIALLQDVLPRAVRTFGEADERTTFLRRQLGTTLQAAGRAAEAELVLRRAFAHLRERYGPDAPTTLTAQNELARTLVAQARWPGAAELFQDLIERRTRVEGAEHPNTLVARNQLAGVLLNLGRVDESEQMQREVLDARRRKLGENHPDTLISANNLLDNLLARRKLDEAEALARDVLERRRSVLGPDVPETITSVNRLGICLMELNRFAEAEQMFRDAAAGRAAALGKDHPQTLLSEHMLAESLMRQEKPAEAEPLFARVTAAARGKVPDESYRRYVAAHGLCLAKLQRWSDAEPKLREAYELMVKPNASSGQPDKRLRPVVAALVKVCRAIGNEAEAIRWSQVEQSLTTAASATAPSG